MEASWERFELTGSVEDYLNYRQKEKLYARIGEESRVFLRAGQENGGLMQAGKENCGLLQTVQGYTEKSQSGVERLK